MMVNDANLAENSIGQASSESIFQLFAERGRTRHHYLDAGQVVVFHDGILGNGQNDGWNKGSRGHLHATINSSAFILVGHHNKILNY